MSWRCRQDNAELTLAKVNWACAAGPKNIIIIILFNCIVCISCTVFFVSISQVIGCEDRLQNDL